MYAEVAIIVAVGDKSKLQQMRFVDPAVLCCASCETNIHGAVR